MGGSHSKSEDLRKRAFLTSVSYIDSLQEVPGYFTRTQQTIDFLEDDLSSPARIEMSYTGPPSHLQHSRDVHPFLDRFGPDFHPREKFMDRSHDASIPPSLLPSAESARELREIEVRETMQSLQLQVKETLAKKRDQSVEDLSKSELPTDEQNTLEFLDSIINESMDIDLGDDENDGNDEREKDGNSEANWIMRDKSKTPLPGLMHSTVPVSPQDQPDGLSQPSSRPASGFFRNSMYLPDTDPIHSPSGTKGPPPPTKPKPANRLSRVISVLEDFPPRDYPVEEATSPSFPVESNHAVDIHVHALSSKEERSGSKNSNNSSTEDMGIVVDDITSDEGSRNGDTNNPYDTKSRVKGVRALVSMYSEEASSPTEKPERIDFSPKRPFSGIQLPVRDYMFFNNNNSNVEKVGDTEGVAERCQRFGTISSEDSALGDSSRDPVDDAVLGVIHTELQKLRMK
ncbi:uncharacterized protein LOC110978445 [Acanthaster planci]|uniref:Uncharacterized protein LOC110978445 n=1 Tax=Acanthaster planci TaxID=133434 RepID=A0A8B7Y9U8_ACAPL|nr:uncharacterized protein LOC110978445 [Acanthaster planci]